jgi:hypothetical protein
MYKEIKKCRICSNTELVPVIDVGEQYLTGIFPKNIATETLTKGPLRLIKCHGGENSCGLLQLEHSYDLNELYGDNYGYRSGLNASMVRHLHSKVEDIVKRSNLNKGDLVIDIGSNDGTTLAAYPKHLQLVGFDPTGGKFKSYYEKHIVLIPNFFSSDLITSSFPQKKAKVVTSLSMFYDLEDPIDFACQVADILDPYEGIWVLEQSYMPLMLEWTAYDTICHEHLEYYGLMQIVWLMDKAGLEVVDVELNDVNGGSVSIVVVHQGSNHKDANNVLDRLIASENGKEFSSLEPYKQFARRAKKYRQSLQHFVKQAKREGNRICGLGASTKGNVILQYCGFGPDDIEVIGDVNKEKYGALTPGTWIPIESEEKVLATNPDYLIVLPWHFKDFFLESPKFKGRNLVFPLPYLETVTPK